jgi:hypothetical protein
MSTAQTDTNLKHTANAGVFGGVVRGRVLLAGIPPLSPPLT